MLKHSRRGLVRASGAAFAVSTLGAFAGRAGAQGTQPLETVRIVTGFPPGGTSDTLCRRVAEGIKNTAYTKSAIVENKAGAGGQIAWADPESGLSFAYLTNGYDLHELRQWRRTSALASRAGACAG